MTVDEESIAIDSSWSEQGNELLVVKSTRFDTCALGGLSCGLRQWFSPVPGEEVFSDLNEHATRGKMRYWLPTKFPFDSVARSKLSDAWRPIGTAEPPPVLMKPGRRKLRRKPNGTWEDVLTRSYRSGLSLDRNQGRQRDRWACGGKLIDCVNDVKDWIEMAQRVGMSCANVRAPPFWHCG